MAQNRVSVIGSCHALHLYAANRLPEPGETILGTESSEHCAGKGSNLAFGARKLGCEVVLIERMGDDRHGHFMKERYEEAGIDHEFVFLDKDTPSGAGGCFNSTDGSKDNSIIIVPNANFKLSPDDIDAARDSIAKSDAISFQLEVPLETVKYAMKLCCEELNVRTVLDPAPARPLDDEVFKYASIIKPNEHEAELITGIPIKDPGSAIAAGAWMLNKGVREAAIVTLGGDGFVIVTRKMKKHFPSIPVKVYSTGGAGDTFGAGLMAGLAKGMTVENAVCYAQCASAYKVGREDHAYPAHEAVMELYNKYYS